MLKELPFGLLILIYTTVNSIVVYIINCVIRNINIWSHAFLRLNLYFLVDVRLLYLQTVSVFGKLLEQSV